MIRCPCGAECFDDLDDNPEARKVAASTFHWKAAELRNAAVELGDAGRPLVKQIDDTLDRMHEAGRWFVSRVLGRELPR